MSEPAKRIIDKLKKLLALAADPAAAPNESATARRQAEALMARHRIDEAEVLLANGSVAPCFTLTTSYFSTTPHYPGHTPKTAPDWAQYIIVGVGVLCEVRVSVTTHRVLGARFKVAGTVEDVAMAGWLYDTLCRQTYQASRRAVVGKGAEEARAFRRGYALAVQKRLQELAKGSKQQAAASTALVVVDTAKQAALDEAFGAQEYGRAREVVYSQLGYAAGQQAVLPTNRPVNQQTTQRLGG